MQRKLFIFIFIFSLSFTASSCDFPYKDKLIQISEDYHLDFLKPILGEAETKTENHDEEHNLSSHSEIKDHEKHSHSKEAHKHDKHDQKKDHHDNLSENHNFSQYQIDYGILWVQNSAEYSALCHQAYNLARYKLTEKLNNRKESKKKPAIILDLDETVLDNSPFQAKLFLNQEEYSQEAWDHWVELAKAEAIPGAKTFLDSVDPEKVEIFYVSNRHIKHLDVTYDNLKKLEIPVKKSNILLKESSSSKEMRRKLIHENYEILLLLGDNLIDFSPIFDANPSSQFRYRLMETLHDEFGDKYIVLPNPNYGQWLSALYNYNYELSSEEKYQIARDSLLSF